MKIHDQASEFMIFQDFHNSLVRVIVVSDFEEKTVSFGAWLLIAIGFLYLFISIDPLFDDTGYIWTSEGPNPWYYGSLYSYLCYSIALFVTLMCCGLAVFSSVSRGQFWIARLGLILGLVIIIGDSYASANF